MLIFGWICCLVKIMKMKYDQDFFQNLWYDLKKFLWLPELNSRVRCAFGNVFHNIMSKNVSPVACRPFWMIMIICKNHAHDDDAMDADDDDAKDAHDDVGSLRWNDGGRVAGVKTREDFYCNTLPSTSLFTPRNALKQNIILIIVLLCLYWPIRTTMITI